MKTLVATLLLTLMTCMQVYGQDLETARRAIDAEQYEKAKGILENLVKSEPTEGENYFQLGVLYLIIGEDALAGETFNKGITVKDNGKLNYIGLGLLAQNDGNTSEASALFEKALQGAKKKGVKENVAIARAYTQSYHPDYAKAVAYAQQAIDANDKLAEAYLILGDAEYNLSKPNEAYAAYRDAYELDNSLLRAKLHMAVITKNARAFANAVKEMEEVATINPDYGPVYRELAETYYMWSVLDKKQYGTYIEKALANYKKYMSLTDYSLDSRMRHADFLVLAKDYATLEKEAMEMQKIDKVNPRILRYLGYSAYENGNYDEAIDALTRFVTSVDPKRIVGSDYLYLAKAEGKLAITQTADTTVVDSVRFGQMITYLNKGAEMKTMPDESLSVIGVDLYKAKLFNYASELFDVLIRNPQSTLLDKLYYSNAVLYNAAYMDSTSVAGYQDVLHKADSVYAAVIKGSPTTQDTYLNRARLNRFMTDDSAQINIINYSQEFIDVVASKGDAEMSKESVKPKLAEAYTTIGSYYAELDKQKAIESFEKAIALDPQNEHAVQSLKFLKKK